LSKRKYPTAISLLAANGYSFPTMQRGGGADDALDATLEAFTYGFALGMRYLKNKKAPVKRQGRA